MDAKLREFELAVYEPSITADGFMRALGRLGLTMLNATPSQTLVGRPRSVLTRRCGLPSTGDEPTRDFDCDRLGVAEISESTTGSR